MKTKFQIATLALLVLPAFLRADVIFSNIDLLSTTNAMDFAVFDSSYDNLLTGQPMNVAIMQVSIDPQYTFTLDSISMYMGWTGQWSATGAQPNVTIQVFNALNGEVVGSSSTVTLATAPNDWSDFPVSSDVPSYVAPYLVTFEFPSLTLPGSSAATPFYYLGIDDNGEELVILTTPQGLYSSPDPSRAQLMGPQYPMIGTVSGTLVPTGTPEPSTLALLGAAGGLGLLGMRRLRRVAA